MVQAEFGAFLSQLRKEKGLTQKQLAEALFVSDKAVSRWECGNGYPDISQLQPLAEVLGVSLAELLNAKRMDEPARIAVANDAIKSALNYSEKKIQSTRMTFRLKLLLVLIGIAILLNLHFGTVLDRIVFGTRYHFTELFEIFYFSRFWMAFVALVFVGAACLHPQKRAYPWFSLAGCIASVASTLVQIISWHIAHFEERITLITFVCFSLYLLTTILLVIALFQFKKPASGQMRILLYAASICVLVSVLISMVSLNYYPLYQSILRSIALASPMLLLAVFLRIQSSAQTRKPCE